ncbi:SHOCT domain-containing protein [Micromonospora aurantiaca (nom. illeg.)]|uniref:SHOCT domain-containing protein n=1 Tax=Micromonospora aurantiaca (nom. illeg.) TaxID=47850 RepID=UPI00161C0F1B
MGPWGVGIGWTWLWWLLLLVGVAAMVAGLALAARSPSGEATGRGATAREILDVRFARGEIGEEEYRQRLREPDEH